MHCSSTVNIADLRSYALQNLVGTHRSQTFLYPLRLPLLPLATFVRTARLPSTSPNSVHTHCRTLFVCAAVLHSTLRSPATIIANLGSDALQNVIGMHRCATFVRAARLLSTLPASIRTCCRTLLVCTSVRHFYVLRVCRHYRWLHSYALLVGRQHRRPTFVCVAEPRWYTLQSDIFLSSASAAIMAGYICTCCSSAINIAELRSYALLNHVATQFHPTLLHSLSQPP